MGRFLHFLACLIAIQLIIINCNYSFLLSTDNRKTIYRINGNEVTDSVFNKLITSLEIDEASEISYESPTGGVTEFKAFNDQGKAYLFRIEYGMNFLVKDLTTVSSFSASNSTHSSKPLRLDLSVGDNLEVTVYICNISDKSMLFLKYDPGIQPVYVIITDLNSEKLIPVDIREHITLPGNVAKEWFYEILPGNSFEFGQTSFIRNANNTYEFSWGPFCYKTIPPGMYTLQMKYNSHIDQWWDSNEQRWIRPENIWTGEILSKPVKLTLPY